MASLVPSMRHDNIADGTLLVLDPRIRRVVSPRLRGRIGEHLW